MLSSYVWCYARYVYNPKLCVVCVCGLNACVYSVDWVRGHWVLKCGILKSTYGWKLLGG